MSLLLKDSLSQLIAPQGDWRLELLSSWPEIMGDLHKHVRLEKIQGDTLFLGVYESAWMQELHLLSRMLIKTINSFLKAEYVKELRFKAAVRTKKKEKISVVEKKVKITKQIQINSQEQAALEKITDPQLRSVLQGFLIRCYEER